jgi:hypothetical protein
MAEFHLHMLSCGTEAKQTIRTPSSVGWQEMECYVISCCVLPYNAVVLAVTTGSPRERPLSLTSLVSTGRVNTYQVLGDLA